MSRASNHPHGCTATTNNQLRQTFDEAWAAVAALEGAKPQLQFVQRTVENTKRQQSIGVKHTPRVAKALDHLQG